MVKKIYLSQGPCPIATRTPGTPRPLKFYWQMWDLHDVLKVWMWQIIWPDALCNCAGVHSEGNIGLQSEMYQLSLSPDEFVIKQRGRRHSLQPFRLRFADHSDSSMCSLLELLIADANLI